MLRATIDDLRLATGGQLRLGDLPPLDGERMLLTGITHYLTELVPGQIYWPLDELHGAEQRLVEEAFALGAVGVVLAGRRAVPWAGCWSLQVADAWSAWCEWRLWADQHGLTWDDEDFIQEPQAPRISLYDPDSWETTRLRYLHSAESKAAPHRPDDSARQVVIRIHQEREE